METPITTDQTVMVDDTIKEAYLIDVTNCNSYNLHSTMTRKPQNYANLKEELIRMWQLKTTYIVPLVLSTASMYCPKQIAQQIKTANSSPCSVCYNAESSNTSYMTYS